MADVRSSLNDGQKGTILIGVEIEHDSLFSHLMPLCIWSVTPQIQPSPVVPGVHCNQPRCHEYPNMTQRQREPTNSDPTLHAGHKVSTGMVSVPNSQRQREHAQVTPRNLPPSPDERPQLSSPPLAPRPATGLVRVSP